MYCCGFKSYKDLQAWILRTPGVKPDKKVRLTEASIAGGGIATTTMSSKHPEINFVAWQKGRSRSHSLGDLLKPQPSRRKGAVNATSA
jgi:hypothetical protein